MKKSDSGDSEEQAFLESLYTQYSKLMYKTAKKLIAEDAVHEAFFKADS